MKEPRIIFSLDVFPLVNNRWNTGNKLKESIYMTALSVLYCHMWYNDIELYVDETAYKFLYMLPCRVTIITSTENKELWMKSKIHAIEKQTTPFIHIDTDVFIKEKINFDFDRILLEKKEDAYHFHYKKQVDFFNNYTQDLPFWNTKLGHSYNCGVIGFNDLDLRNKFIKAYYDMEDIYLEQQQKFIPLKQEGYEPCIILEQYSLSCLLHYNNIKPNLLLQGGTLIEQAKHANEIGYAHLFGVKKYEKEIIGEIEYRLYKIFPYWYEQIKIALEGYKAIPNAVFNVQSSVA